jgi:hypothetical protein
MADKLAGVGVTLDDGGEDTHPVNYITEMGHCAKITA